MGTGYKVGDLDVTISGVSKDAVSSLDEVIKKLDDLQEKLKVITTDFNGAFNGIFGGISNATANATVKGLIQIQRATESASENVENFNEDIQNGSARNADAFGNMAENASKLAITLSAFDNAYTLELYSGNATNAANEVVSSFSQFDLASQEIGRLSSAWKNMYAELSTFDSTGIENAEEYIDELNQALNNLGEEYLNNKQIIDEANEAFKRLSMTEEEKALADFKQANATRQQRIEYLRLMLATGQAGDKTRAYKKELKELTEEQKQADKAAGKFASGGLSKIIKSVGRIAFYRTIRRGMQILVQTFTESVQSFAQVDENINKTMSQLTSSAKVIQLSFGTILLPIVQAITPVVQQLSYGFANMANAISASMAKMQGLSTYTKINADALQDYQKQLNKTSGALFDFDKFRALSSSSDDNSIFFETADVNEELENTSSLYTRIFDTINSIGGILADVLSIIGQIAEAASPILGVVSEIVGFVVGLVKDVTDFLDKTGLIEPILYGILGVLTLIGAAKILTWLANGGITKPLTSLVSILKGIPTALSTLNTAIHTTMGQFALWGIAVAAVTAAVALLSNWDDFSKGTKIAITVISSLISVLTTAAIAAMALHGALTIGTAVPLIITAVAAGAVAIGGAIKGYANGASDIDSGSVFIAGEAGKTEMVYTGDNGKANVANVQQLAQAVYQGNYQSMTDWWKSAKTDVGGDVYLDGEKIYQNTTSHAKKHGNKWTSA